MKTLAKQVIGGRRKYPHVRKLAVLLTLLVALVGLPSKAQSQDGNWAHSPPGTFLDQGSGALGQSQWQQPAGNAEQPGQPQWQQPANNSGQLGQSQWQQPAGNSGQPGQSQWQQPTSNPGQWQQPSQSQWQPTDNSGQTGQSQWQQPTSYPAQPQWQQPANSSAQPGQWQQPYSGQSYPSQLPQSVVNTQSQPVQNKSGQVGLSPWQQPDESAEQMGQSQEGQTLPQQSAESIGRQTGPFTNSGKVDRPPLLGEVLKQEQTEQQPGSDSLSIDQSSSLSAAAGDAMNTPIGNMAAGALSTFGLGQGVGQGAGQLTPQQIQQMIPGVLNFMMNVMPPPSNRNAGPNTSGFGSFPHFGTNYSTRRPMYRPQSSQGMNRVINNVIRRGGVPGMNQMHF